MNFLIIKLRDYSLDLEYFLCFHIEFFLIFVFNQFISRYYVKDCNLKILETCLKIKIS